MEGIKSLVVSRSVVLVDSVGWTSQFRRSLVHCRFSLVLLVVLLLRRLLRDRRLVLLLLNRWRGVLLCLGLLARRQLIIAGRVHLRWRHGVLSGLLLGLPLVLLPLILLTLRGHCIVHWLLLLLLIHGLRCKGPRLMLLLLTGGKLSNIRLGRGQKVKQGK